MGMDLGGPRGKKKGRARPEMNVTPLVDVVLVLLIIFMVITPMLTKQFWIFLPDRNQTEQPPAADAEPPLVVSVDGSGVIRVNTDVVTLDGLPTKLRRVLAARTNRAVFFDAADDAPFDKAMEALDKARAGGASTIAVSTERLAN